MTVVSKAEFARHVGVSRPAVTKMVNNGRIPVRADGKINLEEAVVAYEGSKQIGREVSADNGRKGGRGNTSGQEKPKKAAPKKKPAKTKPVSPPTPEPEPDDEPITATGITQQNLAAQFNKAKLAEKTYQAKLKEIEYKKVRGELLDRDEVAADARATAEDVRGKLFAIAPKLAPQVVDKTPREAQRMIEDAINKALAGFHTSRFAKEH